jgi:hypothetical protein
LRRVAPNPAGAVGGPETRKSFPEKPAAVADIALSLVCQERSAWSFEVEAHTFGAKW